MVRIGAQYGLIDTSGKEITPAKYDLIDDNDFYNHRPAAALLNGKWGFINQKGEQIIPFLYDDASYFTEGLALVKKDDKYGYINEKNEIVIPFIYDDGALFENGKAWVQVGDKQFKINKLGEEISLE